ncbi:MAG: PorV/PorQ family protein [Paludibacteraceae bacterium]
MKSKLLITSIVLFHTFSLFSQAGVGVYRFLDLPVSSRMAALGGYNISLRDNDLNISFLNPSLLTSETNGVIGLNYANYLSDIQFGSVMYGHNFGDKNFAAIGVQYVDLGDFDGRDEEDTQTGTFTAKDMALYLLYARPLNKRFTVEATLKTNILGV